MASPPRPDRAGDEKSVAVLVMLSGAAMISGLLRELVFANFFGASIGSDAISVVVYLYDMVYLLFYQGALAYAVVPLVAGYRARGDVEAGQDLVAGLGAWLAIAGVVLGMSLMVFGHTAARILFATRDEASVAALAAALRLGAGGLVCVGLASFLSSVLQSDSRFNTPPAGRLAWNAVTIALIVTAPAPSRFAAAAVGLSLGGVAQLGVAVAAMPGGLWRWRPRALISRHVREGAVRSVAALVGVGGAGLALGLGERAILALLPAGNVAIASFAQRTATLASMIGLAFMTVAFSRMALDHGRGDSQGMRSTLARTIGQGVFVLAPAVGIFCVLAHPLVSLLFGRGAFSAADVAVTSSALRLYGLSLVPGFLAGVFSRALFAADRPWSAMGVTASVTVAALGCDLALLHSLGVFAVPVGYTVGLTVASVLSVLAVQEALGVSLAPPLLRALRPIFVAAAAAALLLLAAPLAVIVREALALHDKTADLAAVIGGGLVYMVAYVALSALLKIPELAALRAWLDRLRA